MFALYIHYLETSTCNVTWAKYFSKILTRTFSRESVVFNTRDMHRVFYLENQVNRICPKYECISRAQLEIANTCINPSFTFLYDTI